MIKINRNKTRYRKKSNIFIPFIKNKEQIKNIKINFKEINEIFSQTLIIRSINFYDIWEINFNEIKNILDQSFINFIEWINKNIYFEKTTLWKIENNSLIDFYNNFKFNL